MELKDQIRIIKELIEAAEELNGEFQDGWDDTIANGEDLLNYLLNKLTENVES